MASLDVHCGISSASSRRWAAVITTVSLSATKFVAIEQITYWVYYAYVWVGFHPYSMPLTVSSYQLGALGK